MSSLLKIFKFLRKSGKTVKESINKSTEFIDETLDQEYITGAIDRAKEATGQVAQKAGEVFEKSKQEAEEFMESDVVQSMKNKATALTDDITEKGKALVDKALENEEVKTAFDLVKSKTDLAAEKITKVFDGDTEEE